MVSSTPCTSSLNVAVIDVALTATSVAPSAGSVLVTVGAVVSSSSPGGTSSPGGCCGRSSAYISCTLICTNSANDCRSGAPAIASTA